MNTKVAYLDLLKRCLTGELYEESAWEIAGARTQSRIKRMLHTFLRRYGLALVRTRSLDRKARSEGRDWPLIGYTMIGAKRLDNIQECVERILQDSIPGDFVEAGVWRGGALILMRALLKLNGVEDRKIWAADSFAGMPRPDASRFEGAGASGWDYSHIDYLRVTRQQVESNLDRFGFLDEKIGFLEGWFKDTLPTAPISRIALLRLDGDLYESTMDALLPLYPKVSSGGYVIVDDYNSWPGCKQAVSDYRARFGVKSAMHSIDSHAVFWRVD